MAVTVRLFAALRDAAGTAVVEVAPGTVPTIVDALCARFGEPFATRVTVASGMVDGRRVALDEPVEVPPGSELALLPPFSGGAGVSARRRRGHLLLLAGSLLVPALLVLGAFASRWAFGMTVLVIAVASIVDLHHALAATAVRTVLPAALVLGSGPAALLILARDAGVDWVGGLVAGGVMLCFLLAFASTRRHEAASVVGTTLLAGLVVAVGAGSLIVLHDELQPMTAIGALGVIALTDAAVIVVDGARSGVDRRRIVVATVVAVLAAVVLYAVGVPAARAPLLVAGLALAAVIAALLGARLHDALVSGRRRSVSALLVGTADATLLGAPLAVLWIQTLAG